MKVAIETVLLFSVAAQLSYAQTTGGARLLGTVGAQDHKTFTVPFDLRAGLMLLKGELNGKPAAFLFDTGANNSIADAQAAGLDRGAFGPIHSNGGAISSCPAAKVRLSLGKQTWTDRKVCIMDLSDVSRSLGTRIDGLVGADVFAEFRQVRINLEAHILELEK